MITSFNLYLERKFSDLNIDDIDYDTIYDKPDYIDDANLINKIYLENYNKEIRITWYDTTYHSIKDKIKNRTLANSISEFNEILEKYLIKLFNTSKHFRKLTTKMSAYKMNRIAIQIPDLNAFIIIQYNNEELSPNSLFGDDTILNILSIVPRITQRTVNIVFDL